MSRTQVDFRMAMLSSATDNVRCERCDFQDDSLCRRNSPRTIGNQFPVISPTEDWCGDWTETLSS